MERKTAGTAKHTNQKQEIPTLKIFDPEEISQFDGKEGKPVYIVHKGRVFDVSESKLWKGGLHMRRHNAGTDLTVDIGGAPHQEDVLTRYPQIGIVKSAVEASEEKEENPGFLDTLLERFPMLRRHPHPMTVHFPIALMLITPFFFIIYLLTGNSAFETTALHCLSVGTAFTPVVICTGLLTWKLNYMGKPMRAVTIKLTLSILLFIVAVIALALRWSFPEIIGDPKIKDGLYLCIVLALAPIVAVIGWFGAHLTFPIEKN